MLAAAVAEGVRCASVSFSVATFNTKDFFAPGGPITPALFRAKVEHVAGQLLTARADLVALQEVGHQDALASLTSRLKNELPYAHVASAPPDRRGIRCAVLSRLPFESVTIHAPATLTFPGFVEGDPPPFGTRMPLRRPVVHVRVRDEGGVAVDVLVAHFKSLLPMPLVRANGEAVLASTGRDLAEGFLRSLVWRSAEALFVRSLVDDVLSRDANASVLVAGDLNDGPSSVPLQVLRGKGPQALAAVAERIAEAKRFSLLHEGQPVQLDHILVTEPLLRRLKDARFLNENLRDHGPYSAQVAPSADSDHAPLVAEFL
jgi:endonuclease/exonuclease/phosphatase family metal-dependent hydrolase